MPNKEVTQIIVKYKISVVYNSERNSSQTIRGKKEKMHSITSQKNRIDAT